MRKGECNHSNDFNRTIIIVRYSPMMMSMKMCNCSHLGVKIFSLPFVAMDMLGARERERDARTYTHTHTHTHTQCGDIGSKEHRYTGGRQENDRGVPLNGIQRPRYAYSIGSRIVLYHPLRRSCRCRDASPVYLPPINHARVANIWMKRVLAMEMRISLFVDRDKS